MFGDDMTQAGIGNMVHFARKEVLADISAISTVAGELAVATQARLLRRSAPLTVM